MNQTLAIPKKVLKGLQLTPTFGAFRRGLERHFSAVESNLGEPLLIAEQSAPSEAEYEAYRARYAEINEGMKCDEAALKKRLARLFLLFPLTGQNVADTADVVDAYASVLSKFPLMAIDAACKKVIDSGATFRPSAPELYKLANEACEPFFEEADMIRKVLDALLYAPRAYDYRERIRLGFKKLLAEFNDTNGVGFKSHARAIRDVEAGFPHIQSPLTVSDRLRAMNAERQSVIEEAK